MQLTEKRGAPGGGCFLSHACVCIKRGPTHPHTHTQTHTQTDTQTRMYVFYTHEQFEEKIVYK